MALPRKLKNMNVFYNGENFIGQAAEVTLPKLARKMEAWRGGGMTGEVKIDMGMEALELEATYGGLMAEMYRDFGIAKIDGVMLRFAGAYQRDDTDAVDAVEIVMRGRHEEIDPGNAKAGDDTSFKVKSALSYYKLSINNETLVEIDLINMIERVNGEDRLAQQRKAIGL
ncbi:MAG: phage major tail tube protein [Rubrivivax sp.]